MASSSSSSSSSSSASITLAELANLEKVPLNKIVKMITQIVTECPNMASGFSTLVSMLTLTVGPFHVYKLNKLQNELQKFVDLQRRQDERIENLEEDNGSLKAMLKEMQEQTREMKEQTREIREQTRETREADALARDVMKEAYDKQINMLQEALSAIVERKAV